MFVIAYGWYLLLLIAQSDKKQQSRGLKNMILDNVGYSPLERIW